MAVASFHPSTGDDYYMTVVPALDNEVISIVNDIRKQPEPVVMSPPKSRPQAQPTYQQETRSPEDDPNSLPFWEGKSANNFYETI